jgi:hypothetical protein
VFKAAVVNGAAYNYFYDAFAQRRFKSYPLDGVNDEYFHSVRNELLTDQGVDSITTSVAGYPVDDYVWLDGRPVAVVRGKFDGTWTRLPDSTANCMRNDEPAACGVVKKGIDKVLKTARERFNKIRITHWENHVRTEQIHQVLRHLFLINNDYGIEPPTPKSKRKPNCTAEGLDITSLSTAFASCLGA